MPNGDAPWPDTAKKLDKMTHGELLSRIVDLTAEVQRLRTQNAKMREIIEEAYDSTVNTPTYPDGPCIDSEIRAKMRDVLKR